MQQAVFAGQQRHERTERGDLDDGSEELLADLGVGGVGNGVHLSTSRLSRGSVDRTDVHGAVFLDRDVGSGLVLNGVDRLALGADQLTNLVDRNLNADHARCRGGHLVRAIDGLVDHREDGRAGLLGLTQRLLQDRRGDAVELGVELNGRDEIARSGNLEVHVAECVFRTEDVGESGVLGFTVHGVGHEAHGDTRNGCAQWHTGVEQRQGGRADRTHRRRTVGAESLGHLTDGVGELIARWKHRHEGALGQEAVPDLATLRATYAAGLTGRIGREVVVVHVALALGGTQRVNLLFHLEHVERGHTQNLGLTALEDRRAVNARDNLHLGVERTDVCQATAVDAHALGEDAAANDLLGGRLVGAAHLCVSLGRHFARLNLGGDCCLNAVFQHVVGVLALDLVGNLVDARELVVSQRVNSSEHLVGVRQEDRVVARGLGCLVGQLLLSFNELTNERLGCLEPLGHNGLVGLDGTVLDELPATLGSFGLNHHDGHVVTGNTAGNNQVEHGALELLGVGECHPLSVDQTQANTRNGAREREARELSRRRSGVDGQGVVELAGGDGHDRDDDLHLVADSVGKRRTQGAVNQTADQDGLRRGATLATEERSGNLAGCVAALFNVYGQREKVELLFGLLAHRRGREQHGFLIEVCSNGSLSLLREASCLEAHGALAELAVIEHGFGEFDFWTFHRSSPSMVRTSRVDAAHA